MWDGKLGSSARSSPIYYGSQHSFKSLLTGVSFSHLLYPLASISLGVCTSYRQKEQEVWSKKVIKGAFCFKKITMIISYKEV